MFAYFFTSILFLFVLSYQGEDDASDGYFTSAEGSFIPNQWEQFYNFCRSGEAPTKGKKVFEEDDDIGVASP